MGIIETKTFVDENGVERKVDIYKNGMTIERDAVETEIPEPLTNPVMEKLDIIEAKIQTNEDLQTFYDEIVKEVGL